MGWNGMDAAFNFFYSFPPEHHHVLRDNPSGVVELGGGEGGDDVFTGALSLRNVDLTDATTIPIFQLSFFSFSNKIYGRGLTMLEHFRWNFPLPFQLNGYFQRRKFGKWKWSNQQPMINVINKNLVVKVRKKYPYEYNFSELIFFFFWSKDNINEVSKQQVSKISCPSRGSMNKVRNRWVKRLSHGSINKVSKLFVTWQHE